MTDLTYFAQYGRITNPDPYAHLYKNLPSDVPPCSNAGIDGSCFLG
jgi:hypothetical protein